MGRGVSAYGAGRECEPTRVRCGAATPRCTPGVRGPRAPSADGARVAALAVRVCLSTDGARSATGARALASAAGTRDRCVRPFYHVTYAILLGRKLLAQRVHETGTVDHERHALLLLPRRDGA